MTISIALTVSYEDQLEFCMGDLLKAVLQRLAYARMPSMIQGLVFVFARLINLNAPVVLHLIGDSVVKVPVKPEDDENPSKV